MRPPSLWDSIQSQLCHSSVAGLKFWKVGSRKIYVVSENDLRRLKYAADSSSSDSDLEPPPRKFSKITSAEYSAIIRNIQGLRSQFDSLMNVQATLKVPLSLRKILLENFKCVICQGTMTPPIIFAKCCKRLLGCESCVDSWYRGESGMTKTCPQCRSERAYADTCRVHGIDEFLNGVLKLVTTDDAE